MCTVYKYWEARKRILDEMKQSDNYDVKYQQILKIYFIVYVIMLAEVSLFIFIETKSDFY